MCWAYGAGWALMGTDRAPGADRGGGEEGVLPAVQPGSIGIGEDDSCLRLWPEGKNGERFDVRMPGGCGSCWELRLLAAFPLPKPVLPALPRGPGLAWGKKTTEATQDQNISDAVFYTVVQDRE